MTIPGGVSNDPRLRFFGIGAQDYGQFPRIARALRKMAPGILDQFYAKIAAMPETAGFFPTQAKMDGAKDAQLAHWTNLLARITGSVEQVERGVALVGRSGEAFERIVGKVSDIATPAGAITDFSRLQAGNLDQLNGMDAMSRSNAASAEQAVATAGANFEPQWRWAA